MLVTSSDPLFDQVKTTAYVADQFMPAPLSTRGFWIPPHDFQTMVLIIKMDLSVCIRGVLRGSSCGVSRHGHIFA